MSIEELRQYCEANGLQDPVLADKEDERYHNATILFNAAGTRDDSGVLLGHGITSDPDEIKKIIAQDKKYGPWPGDKHE